MRLCEPGRRLLVLQNPGRGSRNYLDGIIASLRRMGVQHCVLELNEIWEGMKSNPQEMVQRLSQILVQHKVGAVLGYGHNGMTEMPVDQGPLMGMRSFFEVRNVPHVMLWLDHPQWHAGLAGLSPELQGMFRSGNCVHLMKSAAHGLEMERMAGWPNCFELPAGYDPAQFPVSAAAEMRGGKPVYDLVAICSERGELPGWLKEFAALDDPDPKAIRKVILAEVNAALEKLWQTVPENMRAELTALGRKWAGLKAESPFLAAHRHWPGLVDAFPGACWFLTLSYPTYMAALRILWRLREWERRFYLAYLSRYFRVGVYGGDWSAMGLGPGGWVDFKNQPDVYATGKVALNITDGHDEEGLTMKPFEIAGSGVPMLHYHAEGLAECFEPGREVEVFRTPREARMKLEALIGDAGRRKDMAGAALARATKDHTWDNRIERMFMLARLPIAAFR